MTNGEKYKTAKERAGAFYAWCDGAEDCEHCPMMECGGPGIESFADWLDLEAPAEEPLPCPFCGHDDKLLRETNSAGSWLVHCYICGYRSMNDSCEAAAISAHNRVARAAKAKEAK